MSFKDSLADRISALEDRIAIYDLQNRYCDAVTRHDEADYIACWHPNGVWEKFKQSFNGIEAIAAEFHNIMTSRNGSLKSGDIVSMTSTAGFIELDGQSGRGRTYTHEVSESDGGYVTTLYGIYNDIYARHEGKWLYISRRFSVINSYSRLL